MLNRLSPIRLLFEVLFIIIVGEAMMMFAMSRIAPGLSETAGAAVDALGLALLTGPAIYWRCMAMSMRASQAGGATGGRTISIGAAVAMTTAAQFAGLALTGFGVVWGLQQAAQSSRAQFELAAQRLGAEVLRRIEDPRHGIEALAGLYAAGLRLERANFHAYFEAASVAQEHPGSQALAVVEPVSRSDLEAVVAAERVTDPGFAIAGDGGQPQLLMVRLVEPAAVGLWARGSDLGAVPAVRKTLQRAIDSGSAVIGVAGGPSGADPRDLIYAMPLYRPGAPRLDPGQRRAALAAVVVSAVSPAALLKETGRGIEAGFVVRLVDGADSSTIVDLTPSAATDAGADAEGRPRQALSVPVGDLAMQLRIDVDAARFSSESERLPLMIGLGGLLFSFLFSGMVWAMAIGRVRAQLRAKRMTVELDRLAMVVRRTSDAVTITDAALRITWINEGFSRMSGYGLDEARGRVAAEMLRGPHTDPLALARLRDAAARAVTCRVELQVRRRDGIDYWVETEIQPLLDDSGKLNGFIEIGSDISAAKADQQRLAEMADRLSLAIAGGNDGLWDWIDVDDDRQWWSPRMYTQLGYAPGEIEPCTSLFESLVHPDGRDAVRTAMRDALNGGDSLDAEFQLRCADGGYRWFHARAKVQFAADGRARRMSGSLQDTTERRQAADALQANERFMRFVTDSIPATVSYWTPELHCRFANSAYVDWIGLRPDEIVGMTLFDLVGEQRFHENEPHVLAALRGEDQRLERSRIKADGTEVRYWLHFRPDRDGDTVKGFLSVMIDVTDLKNAELQLQLLNATLSERTAQAEAANIAKSQFLANMSHEIRTPMNAVLGMLTLLRKTELSVNQLDYVDKAQGAARSLLGLLNDILDFSKAEAGKMTLDPRPFRMESLLRDLSVILSASVGTKRIEVLLDVDPQVPDLPLVGDDMRLRQVLINLGGNAIKFTADGEVVVKVGVAERDADSVLIAFSVRDSGIGIAPEQQRRVFDGFSQAESSTTRRFGGTGLGLAISRRLVELMGGELHLDSEVGVGSDFHFQIRFPIGAVSADEAVPGAATSGLRVLIVDDNPSARVVLAAMAASLGWRADVVASGPAAIQCSTPREGEPFPYQVVFVDWQMPGMDGWETSQHLRRIAGGADAPVVVMVTAHGRDMLHQRSEAEQRMLNGFLVKPVTASMLFDAVADARLALAHPQLVRQRPTDGPRRLDGLNILVAEDNANNQQVVRELLSAEGARITIAADGRQAVAAVAQADPPFDAVLMDVQMPEMDGYAATAEIRGRLGKDRLPIIAMTANAMHSDREACLAAGMNDHVGKPFDLDVLVATLNRHTGRADVASGPQPVVDQAAPLPEDLTTGARAQGIEVDKALMRLGGRVEIYLGMLRRFGDDLPQLLAQASSEFQRGQRVDAGRTAHTIKGLAATLGIPALATQAGEIERHLARPDGDAADEARLFAELTRVVADLRVVLARLVERLSGLVAAGAPEAGATLVDRGALRGFFDELCRLLADSDLGALELRSRMPVIGDTLDTAKLEALDAALAALDFESAKALSRSLADELEG